MPKHHPWIRYVKDDETAKLVKEPDPETPVKDGIMIPADQLYADMLVPPLPGYETPKIDK